MSSAVHYIEVPYARNSFTSTLSSSGVPSHTLPARSLSDVHPTLEILDESILDPGKFLNMPFEKCCRHAVSKSTTSSSSITVPTGVVTMETKSDISYHGDSQESAECSHSVLDDDPVLDPNKLHTVLVSESTASSSHSTVETQQGNESSLSSGRFSPSARRMPDGQTDDPDDHSSVGGDEKNDYMSDDDHDEAEVSDTNAEYTPSNSSTVGGYLPSGSESDEEESDPLKNAISKTSTLSSRVVKVKDDDDINTEIDFIVEEESNKTATKKPRPKTALHRTPPKDPKAKEGGSATKTVGCHRGTQSPSRMKHGATRQQKGKHEKKETLKTKYGGTKMKLKSPRDKKFSENKKSAQNKQPCPNIRPLQHRGSRINSPRDLRKSPYSKQSSRNKKFKRTFKTEIGDKFVNLVEDVVTQMSLLGDDDDNIGIDSSVCPTPTLKPQKKEKIIMKHRREAKDPHPHKTSTTKEPTRSSHHHPLRSDNSSNKLLMEQLQKWKNDYMRGLSMYIEDQLKQFDRSNSLVWNTLSNEGIHKKEKRTLASSGKQSRLADPMRKPCHTCDKKPVNMVKLRSIWNRPGTASKSGKVLPRLLVSSDKTPPLGSEMNKTRLRREVRQRLKTLRLARNSVPILAANDIKLVCHSYQLIMVGEGSTSISILGHLLSEKAFLVVKMFKLPYAGGRTIEIIDQSLLAGHVNKTNATPKFYGLVALDPVESTAVGVHDVAMAFRFIGHTPSCAVTTLSTLCEKAATSQMYRDPDADTRTSKLNAVTIMKDIVAAMNKVHYANVVMPGLDVCKVLLCEEEGVTRPYLSSRLHPMKDESLAWPMVAYLSLKNSKPSSYSQKPETEVPPESIRRGNFTIKSDVFQLGKMMFQVAQAFNISHLQYLARRCLRQDPLHRPDTPKIQSDIEKIINEYQNSCPQENIT